jgi:pimeloyl-ACP methyl ester carboxylesterase
VPEVAVNGVTLVYDVFGEGDPVVLVPGRGFPRTWWTEEEHVRPYLEAGYSVVRYDIRGMPPSSCPEEPFGIADLVADLAGLLEALELRGCALVGYSMGSFIVQELAAARPDLVRAAVMVATLARQPAWQRTLNEGALELFATGIEIPPKFLIGMIFGQLYDPDALTDDARVAPFIDELLSLPPWEDPGRSGQWRALASYEADPATLAAVEVRSLVIAFERDLLMPPKLAKEVAAKIWNCQYAELPGGGHWRLVLDPPEVHIRVLAFLEEVLGGRV